MKTVLQEIIQWTIENAFNVEAQDGTTYIAIDYEEMRTKFDEWLEKDKKQIIENGKLPIPHVSCPLCGRGITQKMLDTENYVKKYIEDNKKLPTYRQVAKHFGIAVCAAHARLRHCRELMKRRQ